MPEAKTIDTKAAADAGAQASESWGIVEVMGHNTYAGRVSEQTFAGAGFVRVDVPAVPARGPFNPEQPAFTKLIGVSSIYAYTPCSEAVARAVANKLRVQPILMVDFTLRQALPAGETPEEDDYT